MEHGWKFWLDWHHTIAPDNATEIAALNADSGEYLGYVRAIAVKREGLNIEEPPTSIPHQYINKAIAQMKVVPLLRCNNLKESITFYTQILDFTLKYPEAAENEWVATIVHGDAEILLAGSDGAPRTVVYVEVDNVDAVFEHYVTRGLNVPNNPDSPVHNSPLDQTWGLREFYVNDPSGKYFKICDADLNFRQTDKCIEVHFPDIQFEKLVVLVQVNRRNNRDVIRIFEFNFM